jgi:plastocyanin
MDYKTVFLVVLAILASGCISSNSTQPDVEQSPENETSTPTQLNQSSNNTVVFTGSGFEPADITVEQGETVTWVNDGSRTMWVGSDQHPTHTEYAGTDVREHCENGDQNSAAFDQCSTGDRFSFTFEKTGEWGYHNHQPFVSGGTVTVVE